MTDIRYSLGEHTFLSAKATTGAGTALDVSNYRHIVLAVATAGNANLTAKVQGSVSKDEPTWGSAQSVTNHWDYIQIKDLEDASALDGDVGIALTGSDDVRLFEVNVNGLRWVNLVVTAHSAGSITVKGTTFKE